MYNNPLFCRRVVIAIDHSNAGIAQLARASPCQGEGRGFESRFPLIRRYREAIEGG